MKLYKSLPNASADSADLPPQAQAIVAEIRSKGIVRRDELFQALEEKFRANRQSPKTIFSFYRGKLIKDGYMMEVTL